MDDVNPQKSNQLGEHPATPQGTLRILIRSSFTLE